MPIVYHKNSHEFHLYNDYVSYLIQVMDNGQLGMLYYGAKIADKESFSYLMPKSRQRPLTVYINEKLPISLQYTAQEYPSYGTGDFHCPAFSILQKDGSRISDFHYVSHSIYSGKKKLEGLPATYVESSEEADSMEITLKDDSDGVTLVLLYTVFSFAPAIARSVKFVNCSHNSVMIERAMSLSLDLPDDNFEMVKLCGAWSRERHVKIDTVGSGIQSIGSMRGNSSAEYNPFFALKRPSADEFQGEVYAFSLIYSGNFLAQVEDDTDGMIRAMLGIHPETFNWKLNPGESFQTPEAVMVYSGKGLNGMSQTFHRLYGKRLARGPWRDRERPIVFNNWEVTAMDFDEDSIMHLAEKAAKLGAEVFVLDDGWFGKRIDEKSGLGDWTVNLSKLPGGISKLADKIEGLGMRFGLWIEPEMVNADSNFYRAHHDWILHTPKRCLSVGRHQYVLDFSRPEVVDAVYNMLYTLLSGARISYLKWDMNRYLTDCFSAVKKPYEQGQVFHEYILGVYRLYENLLKAFPNLLIESCSSGGSRFDPGILYYAPQGWISDDTDGVERVKIQYGTSFVYPLSSMCAHVTAVPNQQVGRITPLEFRIHAAMFGVFGLELNVCKLDDEDFAYLSKQIAIIKKNRRLLQFGTFWRLSSPFYKNYTSWMVVSADRKKAIAAYYRFLNEPNQGWKRIRFAGLGGMFKYSINKNKNCIYGGDELMKAGLILQPEYFFSSGDFASAVFYIEAVDA